tara:strand:+ start:164 stop:346 length:183 start_codon:yes stop_codon:yes gene_type:complete
MPTIKFSNPLKTDKTIIKAAVPIVIPNIETLEARLTKLFFDLKTWYFFAIKKEKNIKLFV